MTATVTDWRVDLIKAHPGLFHPPAGAPEAAQGYPDCGDGWQDLLEHTLLKIEAALADGGTFTALRINEKFGTLRFYWNGRLSHKAKAKVQEPIDAAEARSACTCSHCGEEGCLYRAGGELMTRLVAHAQGQPVVVNPGLRNLHLMQGIGQGGVRSISGRRYDRSTDTFIDVSPDSLKIEE
jgi:hypothetical protein